MLGPAMLTIIIVLRLPISSLGLSLALAGLGSLVVLAVYRLAIGLTLGGWLSNWASFFITLRADGENLDESQRPLQQRPLVGDRRLTGH